MTANLAPTQTVWFGADRLEDPVGIAIAGQAAEDVASRSLAIGPRRERRPKVVRPDPIRPAEQGVEQRQPESMRLGSRRRLTQGARTRRSEARVFLPPEIHRVLGPSNLLDRLRERDHPGQSCSEVI